MSNFIEDSKVCEIEKQIIIEIEKQIGYKFNILDREEFFYVFRPIFYSLLETKYGWPPNNAIFEKFQDIEDKSLLEITIEGEHITGLSIQDDPITSIEISHLPESIKNLKFLKYLTINNYKIKNVHQFLKDLRNLEFLSLANTRLVYESEIFNNLKSLIGLDLAYFPRNLELINSVCNITSLQILDLSGTNLKAFQDCLYHLSNLQILDLSYKNNIKSFPRNLKVLTNLERLYLNKVGVEIFPEDIQLPLNLKEINLKSNHFIDLPDNFEDLLKLEKIVLDSDVIANYVRKTRIELSNEFRKKIEGINFANLYSLAKKKKRFLDLLNENWIDFNDVSRVYKDLLPPIKLKSGFNLINLEEKENRRKLVENFLLDDKREINSLFDDLKWICENQVTIKEVVLQEKETKRVFNLSRLNIFVGKNNSGKSFTLKQLFYKIWRITSDENQSDIDVESKGEFNPYKEGIECFFIPKNRIYHQIETRGSRKGFSDSLRELLNNIENLKREENYWVFDKIIEIINFFNSTDEEVSELEASQKNLFIYFKLILQKWTNTLKNFFPDIVSKLPKRSDFNTVYEFDCQDRYIASINYNFNDLGSGMQELYVLIFFIELLKYLPKFDSNLKIVPNSNHRFLFIDEPDLSLHPELQENLFTYLINSSHRIQIILTTQSPFIPSPVKNFISIKLFRKDNTGFHFEDITKNNYILILEDLFRYKTLEIASYLSKDNYKYFKKLEYNSKEFSMGSFVDRRYDDDKNYLELLNLGTVNWNMKNRILQNAYFLSFAPEVIDLNKKSDVASIGENHLRVFIIQLNRISDKERKKLIEKLNKDLRKQNYILRLIKLCVSVWDKKYFNHYILRYNHEQQDFICDKIRKFLKEIEEDLSEYKNLIVFPENSLPYTILPFLLEYSKKNKIVIVGGMEHCTINNFNHTIDNLKEELRGMYKYPINYSELEGDNLININTYINQALIINGDNSFTFQIKNLPVYFNSVRKKEGIPIILKPSFKKIQTLIGDIAVLICKDLLVNSDVLATWMDLHGIKILVTPSFTNLVNPFRNKLGEIISNRKQNDKIFIFANISEYGGSGAYNYGNRRDFEPNRTSLFPSCNEIEEEEFRPSVVDWRKIDFVFHSS